MTTSCNAEKGVLRIRFRLYRLLHICQLYASVSYLLSRRCRDLICTLVNIDSTQQLRPKGVTNAMIRINLLPPEFRKGSGPKVSVEMVSLVGGGILCLLLAGLWAWVAFSLKPAAQDQLDRLTQEEADKQRQAQAVQKLKGEIAAIKKKHDVLLGLFAQKVYWSTTLYDFCEMLGRNEKNHWTEPGFMVSCSGISVAASKSSASARTNRRQANEGQKFSLQWEFEIIGEEFKKAGDYVESFFADVETSRFWIEHGFVSKPILTYTGDQPVWIEEVERVKIDGKLEFTRVHNPVIGKPGSKK